MTTLRDPLYAGYRYPSYAVWLYFRFPLSLRMVENMIMTVKEPGPGHHTFGFCRQGALSVCGGGRSQEGMWGVGTGILYRERPGMRVVTSDDHAGTAFELPHERIAAILEALIERPVAADFTFAPTFSLGSEPGPSVARTVAYIE
jgi:hypothetical protein